MPTGDTQILRPKIYHITHVDNLLPILKRGELISDSKCAELDLAYNRVGMNEIKARRLVLPVNCHPGTSVGQYVPFNFCPRSVMLYILYMGNHPDITYRGGQGPIVHLEFDAYDAISWAIQNSKPWTFSDCNAGTYYAKFFKDQNQLSKINWEAVSSSDFRDSQIKDAKQAEFLLYESMPLHLLERIGVYNETTRQQVENNLNESPYQPTVLIEKAWYF